jgi:hypothetical protein
MTASPIATAENSGVVVGTTGVVVTHGLTLQDGDVLVAFIGSGFTGMTGFACSGWTDPTAYMEQAGGNDRALGMLYKVITNAGSEPSTYTFTRTGDSVSSTQAVFIQQWRGIDNATPIDATAVLASLVDTSTPTPPAITTATDGAAIVTANIMAAGLSETFAGVTPVAPASFTLAGDVIASDAGSVEHDIQISVSYLIAGTAGVHTPGAWQTTGGTATWDNIGLTVALRPAAASAAGSSGRGALSSLGSLQAL